MAPELFHQLRGTYARHREAGHIAIPRARLSRCVQDHPLSVPRMTYASLCSSVNARSSKDWRTVFLLRIVLLSPLSCCVCACASIGMNTVVHEVTLGQVASPSQASIQAKIRAATVQPLATTTITCLDTCLFMSRLCMSATVGEVVS